MISPSQAHHSRTCCAPPPFPLHMESRPSYILIDPKYASNISGPEFRYFGDRL